MRLFVRRLTIMDFSYLHAERGLLGESWQVDIELTGQLDDQGMVLDFGDVKREVKRAIDRHFDHKLLVPANHPGLRHEREGDLEHLVFPLADGSEIRHSGPVDAVTLIPAGRITPDTVAAAIVDSLRPLMPANVTEIALKLAPEQIDGAWYQYSHGLKLHCGNCQRIAHGHRSRLEILRNGRRDESLEELWATRWRDIYIGTRDDLAESFEHDGTPYYRFAYQAAQGRFELSLPQSRCWLIDTESTVENIAEYLATQLKAEFPEDRFEVRAYEGMDKGAVCAS